MKINIDTFYCLLGKKVVISSLIEKLNILGFESNIIDNYLDINIPYNRKNCNNLAGILNYISNFDKEYSINFLNSKTHVTKNYNKIKIIIDDFNFCSIYSYAIIDNINIKNKIPLYVTETLKLNNINVVNNLVDIINYITLITGQPMHCYDFDTLYNDIHICKTSGEKYFYSINNSKIGINEDIYVVKSKNNIISIPGIIGSTYSKISQKTKTILLESAFFNSDIINSMSKSLKIFTDSSMRFSNKIDFNFTLKALDYSAEFIKNIFNSKKIFYNFSFKKKYLPKHREIKLNKKKIFNLLNNNIENEKFSSCIDNIYLKKKYINDFITFYIPHYRDDLEIKENVFSEIIKLYGYNNIISKKLNNISVNKVKNIDSNIIISNFLKTLGFNEIISYSFVDHDIEKHLCDSETIIYIKNPITEKMNVMRQTLLQGLMKTIVFNINRQNTNLNLFEIGNIYNKCKDKNFKIETILSIVITDKIDIDKYFFKLKSIIKEMLVFVFKINDFEIRQSDNIFLNNNINLSIFYKNKKIGIIGLIKKNLLNIFNLKQEVVFCSLFIDRLNINKLFFFREISKYPYIIRDLSILLNNNLIYEKIINFINNLSVKYLITVSFLNFYSINEKNKSLTLRFKFGSKIKTLLDEEISRSMNLIIDKLKLEFNIQIKV